MRQKKAMPPRISTILRLYVLFSTALYGGCTSHLENIQPAIEEIPAELLEKYDAIAKQSKACPKTIIADLTLRYASPLKKEATSGYLQFSLPTNYKFSITNPLGQPLWAIAGNDKKFQILDIVHKQYREGRVIASIARNHLPQFLAQSKWGEWLTGRNFSSGQDILRVVHDHSNRGVWLTVKTHSADAPYAMLLIDSATERVLERIILNSKGKRLAVIQYQMAEKVDTENTTITPEIGSTQCKQPYHIHISGLDYNASVELHFSRIETLRQEQTYSLPKPRKGYVFQYD